MVGQLNLFAGCGEEVCIPLSNFRTTQEEKKEICTSHTSDKKHGCSMERLQELYQEAIRIVQDECFPLEPIEDVCYVKEMSAWGRCHHEHGISTIFVSPQLLEAAEKSILETLLHELVHATLGCHNHGSIWKSRVEKLNRKYGFHIKRTNSPEDKGVSDDYYNHYKYVFQCQDCGYKIGYKKQTKFVKHPDWYSCGKCGGKFSQIK